MLSAITTMSILVTLGAVSAVTIHLITGRWVNVATWWFPETLTGKQTFLRLHLLSPFVDLAETVCVPGILILGRSCSLSFRHGALAD